MNVVPFKAPGEPEEHAEAAEDKPIRLNDHALDNLAFIRTTMQRSGTFTSVPGWGMVAMGAIAVAGAFAASHLVTGIWWLYVWLYVAVVGCAVGVGAMLYKAQQNEEPVWAGVGRKALLTFCPAILAGMVLTEIFYQHALMDLMPGMWLLLYGVAVATAGAFSVPAVPIMGLCFMALGSLTTFSPYPMSMWIGPIKLGDLWMAVGFGGLHLIFGLVIARKYGG